MSDGQPGVDNRHVVIKQVDVPSDVDAADQPWIDIRVEAVLDVLSGRPPALVAAEHRVPVRVLERWVSQFVAAGSRALGGQEVADESTVDNLLAIVAHEIRTPLTSATMGLRLLTDPRTDAEDKANMAAIVARQLDLLTELADDVMDSASVALGRMRLRLDDLDLVAVVSEVIEQLGSPRLSLIARPELMFSGDGRKLRRIISNMAQHALRYADGEVRIQVASQGLDVAVVITHHAQQPVTREDAEHWFEPFATGNSSRTGHGLGMYVVRALTVAHAGTLGIESLSCDECRHGQDLRVWVRLPIVGPPLHGSESVMQELLPGQRGPKS